MELFNHKEQVKKNLFVNTLNKGQIADAFGYDNETKYPKTGKEIKEKLEICLVEKIALLKALAGKLGVISEYVGTLPLRDTDDYYFSDKTETLNMCPHAGKIYDNKMCYLDSNQDSRIVPKGFVEATPGVANSKDIADKCSEYNNLVRKCCDLCKEISFAKTLHNNTEVGKTYQFNMKQLRALNL